MNAITLNAAISEARRFMKAAEAARVALVSEHHYSAPKETGAARRASMDLTRALAEMRKPG